MTTSAVQELQVWLCIVAVTAARSAANLFVVSWIIGLKFIREPLVTLKFAIYSETSWRQVTRAPGRCGHFICYTKSLAAAVVTQITTPTALERTTEFLMA